MTHLKLLTILTALALLTACAGGITVNNLTVNNNGVTTDETTACGDTCANYAEWLTENPNLRTVPIEADNRGTDNNTGHYLQGTATGLNAGGAVVTTVTFNDAFDDVDNNPFDGFAYFDGVGKRRYVGILSNTNMGAPLATTSGRAIWKGFISSGEGIIIEGDDFATPTAFDLTVIFNATGGTINAFIPTNIPAGNPRVAFRILGEFDAGGVITGITDRRTYNNLTDVTSYDASSLSVNTVGTLRGLIASDGAVGVFTTDAAGANVPYAGGFVAKPDPLALLEPSADHALYAGVFSPATSVTNLATQETVGFAQPTAEGFSIPEIRFEDRPAPAQSDCSACFPNFIVRLGGDNTDTADTDGFALIYGRLINTGGGSARARVGLLPGTDVGAYFDNVAPDGAMTATWPGTIYYSTVISGTAPNRVITPLSVAFSVDFAEGTFELPSTVLPNAQTISVAGRFGEHTEAVDRATPTAAPLPRGVLGGNAHIGGVQHVLQGLIGTEGAVGVFAVGPQTFAVGGFVAQNAPVLVNHAVYLAQNADLRLSTSTNSAFVRGLDNGSGLDKSSVNFTANDVASSCQSNNTKCILEHTLRLGGNNDDRNDPSGLALFYGNRSPTNVNAGGAYRVGLLSGTDVGFALPLLAPNGMATAEWSGKLLATRDATDGTITPRDLTLTVDYTNRTINGQVSITGGVLFIGGGYNQTGIMTGAGTVTYTPPSGTAVAFNLRGVIGTEGAIGIFQGNGNQHHVGGFIVKPPTP